MRIPSRLLTWPVAGALLLLRATCRIRVHNDPRPALRRSATPYAYAVLHAHQISTVIDGERGTVAMVSRSTDGSLLLAGLKLLGIKIIRGSSRTGHGDKGGRQALQELTTVIRAGAPGYLAVDGPSGPRNRVRKGIAVLSQATGAAVLTMVAIPSRRWIFGSSWDRFQVPKPFSRIDAYFDEPIRPDRDEDVESFRRRIEDSLNQLEKTWDPDESGRNRSRTYLVADGPNLS